MSAKKRNEQQMRRTFKQLGKAKGWEIIKYRDVQFIPCMVCGKMTKVPKSDKKPDYLVAFGEWAHIEAKGANDTFNFETDITDIQREEMPKVPEGWLYLEIGTGRVPKGKACFLVPWDQYIAIESKIREDGYKSIRFLPDEEEKGNRIKVPLTRECLENYRLEWQSGHDGIPGYWDIPENHVFWLYRSYPKTSEDTIELLQKRIVYLENELKEYNNGTTDQTITGDSETSLVF